MRKSRWWWQRAPSQGGSLRDTVVSVTPIFKAKGLPCSFGHQADGWVGLGSCHNCLVGGQV